MKSSAEEALKSIVGIIGVVLMFIASMQGDVCFTIVGAAFCISSSTRMP